MYTIAKYINDKLLGKLVFLKVNKVQTQLFFIIIITLI